MEAFNEHRPTAKSLSRTQNRTGQESKKKQTKKTKKKKTDLA
jgi:hypothetical protein